MSADAVVVTLQLDVQDADPEELDAMTRQLRDELQEQDVAEVDLLKEGSVPEGAKAAELVTMGGLLLSMLPTAMPHVLNLVSVWAKRGDGRKVRIKTQVGDRSVEVEYLPNAMSQDELMGLVATLTSALAAKPAP
jgi:hypothetical protein